MKSKTLSVNSDALSNIELLTSEVPQGTIFMTHAGTNDILRGRSEDVFNKYRTLIMKYRRIE